MAPSRDLPPRVYIKSSRYWLVTADGKKRLWKKLSKVDDGLGKLYRALADLEAQDIVQDTMPAVVGAWLKEVSALRSQKAQDNDAYRMKVIAERFTEFRAGQVTPPSIVQFLKTYRAMPRTFNAYRADLRELMRFSEEKGFRPPGSNPVTSIKTMKTPARTRYITDSELRRIKVGAWYGDKPIRKDREERVKPGAQPRRAPANESGPLICALIDLAYLTGQRIGDLITLEWRQNGEDSNFVCQEGISFAPSKLRGSTGLRVVIEWTPRLKAVIARIKAIKRPKSVRYVVTNREGLPYTYSGVITAWKRALARATKASAGKHIGVQPCTFHDIRAKAITDKDRLQGRRAANTMGAHSTEAQTADYVRHKQTLRTSATR